VLRRVLAGAAAGHQVSSVVPRCKCVARMLQLLTLTHAASAASLPHTSVRMRRFEFVIALAVVAATLSTVVGLRVVPPLQGESPIRQMPIRTNTLMASQYMTVHG